MQIPSNMFINKISRPSLYLSIVMLIWGFLSTITGIVNGFSGMVVVRCKYKKHIGYILFQTRAGLFQTEAVVFSFYLSHICRFLDLDRIPLTLTSLPWICGSSFLARNAAHSVQVVHSPRTDDEEHNSILRQPDIERLFRTGRRGRLVKHAGHTWACGVAMALLDRGRSDHAHRHRSRLHPARLAA